ncbi:MAG: ATP-binding protein [Thalassotalea sp.]|nr:ATP-binding protein [Thalassotalea sp.]
MKIISLIKPKNLAQQMMILMASSLLLLFIALGTIELFEQKDLTETAISTSQLSNLKSLYPLVNMLTETQQKQFEKSFSRCYQGYLISEAPYFTKGSRPNAGIAAKVSQFLSLPMSHVNVTFNTFMRNDFAYYKCGDNVSFPLEGIAISILLDNGKWLNAEVHAHQWHINTFHQKLFLVVAAFIIIAGVSIAIIAYLTKPLSELNNAAKSFSKGLELKEVNMAGSPDLRQTIRSFNKMQKDVLNAIKTRTTTLAAISHDIRTPLTALRLKAELLDDDLACQDLINSIDRIEKITASGLAFLKGDDKGEPLKQVNLSVMISDEYEECKTFGHDITFINPGTVIITCRPTAMLRAIRNVIDNATKYAKTTEITLTRLESGIELKIVDNGPGIPELEIEKAFEPFYRQSKARESNQGGFGLGLAIVKNIIEGHNGTVILKNASPTGLQVTIRLPYR